MNAETQFDFTTALTEWRRQQLHMISFSVSLSFV